ncbi:hypothetical protein HPB47_008957 [Ixodes persulcatus]|uniref:Uncharacterized protein n=1 Tax=Ixodes persulcatus TaxID=34615 RepID=A0AC60P3T1_IXOPE|nr:hypothetical protein HPB47_008957 [Ixodes persulcatus]
MPFSFGYDTVDEYGTKLFHKEQSDANNARTGSYGYMDANGIYRRVNYVADANGFRATIETNEPGTQAGRSADAIFNARPVAAGTRLRAPGGFGASAAYGRGGLARSGSSQHGSSVSANNSRRIHCEEDIKRKKTGRSLTPQSCPSAEEKRMVGSWDKPLCDQLGIEESVFLFRLFKERLQELNFDVEMIKRDTRVANLEDEMRELLREKEREIEKLHLRVREQDATIEAMRSELDTCATIVHEASLHSITDLCAIHSPTTSRSGLGKSSDHYQHKRGWGQGRGS